MPYLDDPDKEQPPEDKQKPEDTFEELIRLVASGVIILDFIIATIAFMSGSPDTGYFALGTGCLLLFLLRVFGN